MGYKPEPGTWMRYRLGPHMLDGLRDLIALLPESLVMAEIGVYAGESTRLFVESGKVRKLFAVDPWAGDYEEQGVVWQSPFAWDEVYLAFHRYAVLHPEIRERRMTSLEAAQQAREASLDFVYIDGNHSGAAVYADIQAWLPKLKPGGWLGGHDWSNAFPGVVWAVTTLLTGMPKVFQDTSWLVKI
jgi:hypothetical protein